MNSPVLTAASRLKRIRTSYIKQLPSQLEKIRTAYAVFDAGNPGQAELKELHRCIHTLRGSSVSFGLGKVSFAAALAEKMTKEALLTGEAQDSAWSRQLEEQFAQMEREVAAIDASQEMSLHGMELIAAAETVPGKEMKTI